MSLAGHIKRIGGKRRKKLMFFGLLEVRLQGKTETKSLRVKSGKTYLKHWFQFSLPQIQREIWQAGRSPEKTDQVNTKDHKT